MLSMLPHFVSRVSIRIGLFLGILCLVCVYGFALSVIFTLVYGAWDFLVWLTKLDWRTTEFEVLIFGFAISIGFAIAALLLLVLGEKLIDWGEQLQKKYWFLEKS